MDELRCGREARTSQVTGFTCYFHSGHQRSMQTILLDQRRLLLHIKRQRRKVRKVNRELEILIRRLRKDPQHGATIRNTPIQTALELEAKSTKEHNHESELGKANSKNVEILHRPQLGSEQEKQNPGEEEIYRD